MVTYFLGVKLLVIRVCTSFMARPTVDVEKFKINNVSWTTIDDKRAKLIQPKNTGTGMTGITLTAFGSQVPRQTDFKRTGQTYIRTMRQLLKAFEALKFTKKELEDGTTYIIYS